MEKSVPGRKKVMIGHAECCSLWTMQAPPAYSMPPRKSKAGLYVGLGLLGFAVCCVLPIGGMVYGGKKMMDMTKPLAACEFTFDATRKALVGYSEKNGGKLPPAAGWTSAIRPYLPKADEETKAVQGILGEPQTSGATWKCDNATTLVYNTEAAGKTIEQARGKKLIVIWEGQLKTADPAAPYAKLPIEQSPTMMGERRGWFSTTIDGPTQLRGKGGDKPFVIRGQSGM